MTKAGSTLSCAQCAAEYTVDVRIKTQPFVAGFSRTFTHWLEASKSQFCRDMCPDCRVTQQQPIDAWAAAPTSCRLEVESRARSTCAGMFPLSPNTTVQMFATVKDQSYRLRDGEAITKNQICQDIVFDNGGGFVRRVASLESWPVSYYSLLAHTNATIDWSRQTVVDRTIRGACSITRIMHESTIGYYEQVERESNYGQPPLHESLPVAGYEDFEMCVNPTLVPTCDILRAALADPCTLFSPKVDGERRHCRLTATGAYMESPSTGLVTFVPIVHCPTIKQTLLVEALAESTYVIIDVAINVAVTQRIAMLNWLRQSADTFAQSRIYVQQFLSAPPLEMPHSWQYDTATLPIDGYIVSPAAGRVQYKLKHAWTVDLHVTRDRVRGKPALTLTGMSQEGYRVVRLPRTFDTSPGYVGEGIYECLIGNNGTVSLVRHRSDRTSANVMCAIIKNVDMAVSEFALPTTAPVKLSCQ